MKIAHVVDSLEIGGAEMMVASLCRLHRASGHSLSVHCLFRGGLLAERLEQEGFAVHVHPSLSSLRLGLSLYQHFRRERYDVVHCHNRTAAILAAPAARMAGAGAVVCTRHGAVSPDYPWRGEMKFGLAARCCDRVVAVCAQAHRNMQARFRSARHKIVTVPNGSAPAAAGAAGAEPVPKEGFTLVHVARLAWAKDQATLLRAVARAAPTLPELRLWMLGDGPERFALRALAQEFAIEDRVLFLGDREDVGRWLASADLFVLSSVTEGTPIALLEAMAAGLPFIVTDVGGMPEIAKLSGAGAIVPKGEPEALAQAILHHARRREELPALGARARDCYLQFFTLDRMAGDYLRVYQECLMARGRLPQQAVRPQVEFNSPNLL